MAWHHDDMLINKLMKERDEARAVAASRASGDPEVRDLLLHYFGTTEPELLRDACESWIAAAKERDRLRAVNAELLKACERALHLVST